MVTIPSKISLAKVSKKVIPLLKACLITDMPSSSGQTPQPQLRENNELKWKEDRIEIM